MRRLTRADARRAWWMRQQLDAPFASDAAAVVEASGWMNTAGSAGPYLSLRARLRGTSARRAQGGDDDPIASQINAAVFDRHALIDAIALRGCAMLVPRADAPLAARCADRFYAPRVAKIVSQCGINLRDQTRLQDAIVERLAAGPQTAAALQKMVPGALVRPLGEDGRKFGESSTLTLALKQLCVDGRVWRTSADRVLHSSRYVYRAAPSARDARRAATDAEVDRALAERFFRWAAPATTAEFVFWSALTRARAMAAIRALDLEPVALEGSPDEAWQPSAASPARDVRPARNVSRVLFLPFRDNFLYFRRHQAMLADPADATREVLDWRGVTARLDTCESLHHHAIVEDGRLIGVWEFDPGDQRIVWKALTRLAPSARARVEREAEATGAWIALTLGDMAFYPFDKGRARQRRLAFVRVDSR